MKNILIIAGDTSGDIHSFKLMKELKSFDEDIQFHGIGGENMIIEGLDSLISLKEVSIVGFWEVAKNYFFFKNLIQKVEEIIIEKKIDLFIAVDFPGFNREIAKFAKSKGIPVIWYIAPQLWAWGENRAAKFAKNIDDLLVVFPFEEEFFRNYEINTYFVGHPLLDIPEFQNTNVESHIRENSILLMPGSRKQELKSHLPILLEVNKLVKENLKDFKVILTIPKSLESALNNDFEKDNKIQISFNSKQQMLTSKAGVVKTGTSNLEACLAELPFVMFYHTSALTYLLGRQLVKLDYLSLVNILSKKSVVKELIQKDANPKQIFHEIQKILMDEEYNASMIRSFNSIRGYLGDSGASRKAAEYINLKYF
ncbi:MAG: lipid-A-disaccharide synthase [Ignavibacteria bacterium GWF2_33_9]|nr:MAG: lipid-A-disaccharide synthase [Ignavibacteria bacterium GWF2_33_9]